MLALIAALAAAAGCSNGDGGEGSGTDAGAPAAAERPADGASADGTSADGAASDVPAAADAIPGLVEAVAPTVVAVLTGRGEGSGVVYDGEGRILTNNHVVDGVSQVRVALASGERLPAEVLATDPQTDLAVLEVDRDDLTPARFAEELPRVGELAVAIGNPLGFENTVTAGIVSGLHRSLPSGDNTPPLVELIQTDAAISPGNSGGALVDEEGRVIGVNVAYIPPQARAVSIGFAIPAPQVVSVADELIEDGRASHAYLGIHPSPLTPDIADRFGLDVDRGVLVLEVYEGTPAADAGLRPGDIVVEAGGDRVEAVEDLYAALRTRDPGDTLVLGTLRDGDRREVTVTLAERSENPPRG